MRINEILLEISAGEKKRLQKQKAQQQRAEQAAAEQAALQKAKELAAKRLSKKIGASQSTAVSVTSAASTKQPAPGPFAGLDPNLFWDPTVDPEDTEDIGVYLKFHRASKMDTVYAYYTKQLAGTYAGNLQMMAPAGWPPLVTPMGKRFSGKTLQALINTLVKATAKKVGNIEKVGYVHIIINRSDMVYRDGDRFFTEMVMWLRTKYPNQGSDEMDPTVNWEIVDDLPK